MNTEIAKAEKQLLMQQVLDSKLSRAELLDLIIDRVDVELRAQIDALTEQINTLPKMQTKDFLPLLRAKLDKSTVVCSHGWGENKDSHVEINFTIDQCDLPRKIAATNAERKRLGAARSELQAKQHRLHERKSSAHIAMIRESLNSSPQGKKILAAIDALKDHVKDNFLELSAVL